MKHVQIIIREYNARGNIKDYIVSDTECSEDMDHSKKEKQMDLLRFASGTDFHDKYKKFWEENFKGNNYY